jgi:hypothetical protein
MDTLEVNCIPILVNSNNTGQCGAATVPDAMVMGEEWALCEFSLLVSQGIHSNLFLNALDNTVVRYEKKTSGFLVQKMSMSGNGKVYE